MSSAFGRLGVTIAVLLVTQASALAGCGYRQKPGECNSFGNDADDYGGCSVETRDGWYAIEIKGSRISGQKVCSKYPPEGYCGCSDYGIY